MPLTYDNDNAKEDEHGIIRISEKRRLSHSQSDVERAAGNAAWQAWAHEKRIFKGTPPCLVQQLAACNRPSRQRAVGTAIAAYDKGGRGYGTAQSH